MQLRKQGNQKNIKKIYVEESLLLHNNKMLSYRRETALQGAL